MELVLTHHSETEVAVSCDGQPSHRFELAMVFPIQAAPDAAPAPLEDPVGYGKRAYAALFGADTPASKALDALPERVVIVATEPALHHVPWEYAYGPHGWVVAEVPFVRGLPAEKRVAAAAVDQPLHVVVVPSHPLGGGLAPLDTQGEWIWLTEIFNETANAVSIERTAPATLSQLRKLVAGERQRVIHFTGHGGQEAEGAVLYFEREIGDLSADEVNASGNVEAVSTREFINHVRGTSQMVVLSACVSATPGETLFNNLAASLVEYKMPYALGMRFSVIDADANAFCRSLYSELARGVPIEEAVRQGRLALVDSSRPWAIGVPVLYTSLETAGPPFVEREGKATVLAHRPRMDLEALPQVTGTLQGRDGNLLALEWYLTGDRRSTLVTIHGPSGQGKTALARVGAERIAHEWPGGVLALNLEAVPSKAEAIREIGRFIGAGEAPADPAAAENFVEAYFNDNRTLLVLDGAEHLVAAVESDDAAAIELGQWLQELPRRRVGLLATSRRYLGWEGELGVELAGLAPQEGAWLFRQTAPQRAGEIDQEQAMALSAQVGGHPLSLRLLGGAFNDTDTPLADFIADFEAQLDRAENKYVQASHRHLTLQTSITTSVSALSDEQRALLSAAWVFQGPFPPSSLAGLLSKKKKPSDDDIAAVAASLHHLWQHSLVERVQYSDGALMYRTHPVLRQYFRRHLPQAVAQATLDQRFARTMAALAQRLHDTRDEDPTWGTYASECREDLDRAVDLLPEDERAAYVEHWGWLCFLLENYERAAELFDSTLAWAKKNDQELYISLLDNLASVKSTVGETEEAIALYKKELTLVRKNEDRFSEAMTLESLGECYGTLEDYARARSSYEDALLLYRKESDLEGQARVRQALGLVYQSTDQAQEAIDSYAEALNLYQGLEDVAGQSATLRDIGEMYLAAEDWDSALENFQQSFQLCEAAEDALGVIAAVDGQARVFVGQERHKEGLALFEQVLARQQEAGLPLDAAATQIALADCHAALGQLQPAFDALNAAGPVYEGAGDNATVASILRKMAAVLATDNQPGAAAQRLAAALSYLEAAELTEDSDGTAIDAFRSWQASYEQQAAAAAGQAPAAG